MFASINSALYLLTYLPTYLFASLPLYPLLCCHTSLLSHYFLFIVVDP